MNYFFLIQYEEKYKIFQNMELFPSQKTTAKDSALKTLSCQHISFVPFNNRDTVMWNSEILYTEHNSRVLCIAVSGKVMHWLIKTLQSGNNNSWAHEILI